MKELNKFREFLNEEEINEGWMDLLTYGPLAITAALSAFFLATDFDLKSVLKGIRAKWREYTNPKVFKVIQKMLNDPEIVSAAKTLILGPRGGKRPDLTDQAYRKALEAKLTPEEMNTLKKFLDKIKNDYIDLRQKYNTPSSLKVHHPGPDYDKAKSLRYLKKYAAGDNKTYYASDYLYDDFNEGKVEPQTDLIGIAAHTLKDMNAEEAIDAIDRLMLYLKDKKADIQNR